MSYPEIDKLTELQRAFNLRSENLSPLNSGFVSVRFYIGKEFWELYVDNEYQDFNIKKQLICLFLILNSLEDYKEADDYLQWCNHQGLDAANEQWLAYFKELGKAYQEIEKRIGPIDPCINSLDYQLRSGAYSALLEI